MKRIRVALGPAVVIFIAMSPVPGLAQSNGVPPGVIQHVAGAAGIAGRLAPPEIVAEVRWVGFEPTSRPIRRGGVYVLSALDTDGMAVELTVDAGSGRVLWINDIVGPRYGGSGSYGYHPLLQYEGRPVPPADIPNAGPARSNLSSLRSKAFVRRSPPLPRTRPADLASGVAKESAPRTQNEPKAAAAPAAAPGRADIVPAATPPRAPPAMVPVAPLE
jgi:hypothetical protein